MLPVFGECFPFFQQYDGLSIGSEQHDKRYKLKNVFSFFKKMGREGP